jgi:hypothetical protein
VAPWGPRAGYNVIAENTSVFADDEGACILCGDQSSDEVLSGGLTEGDAIAIRTWGGAVISRDWYNPTPKI